jgi:hypothetical protein
MKRAACCLVLLMMIAPPAKPQGAVVVRFAEFIGTWILQNLIEYGYEVLMETLTSIPKDAISEAEWNKIQVALKDVGSKEEAYRAAGLSWMDVRTDETKSDDAWNRKELAAKTYDAARCELEKELVATDTMVNKRINFHHKQFVSVLPKKIGELDVTKPVKKAALDPKATSPQSNGSSAAPSLGQPSLAANR